MMLTKLTMNTHVSLSFPGKNSGSDSAALTLFHSTIIFLDLTTKKKTEMQFNKKEVAFIMCEFVILKKGKEFESGRINAK